MNKSLAVVLLSAVTASAQTALPAKGTTDPDIVALENEWMAAVQKHDAPALERFLADDYTLFTSTGEIVDRATWLSNSTRYNLEEFAYVEPRVQIHGNTAVLTSRFKMKASFEDQQLPTDFLLMDVWVKDGVRWRVIARHSSRPAQAPPAPRQ